MALVLAVGLVQAADAPVLVPYPDAKFAPLDPARDGFRAPAKP